jgi:hypothetical protein
MRLSWLVPLLVVAVSCREAVQDTFLSVNVRPSSIKNDGSAATVTASAQDKYGDPGQGGVKFSSTAGNLTSPVTVKLNEIGEAKTEFTCDAAADPNCLGDVTITAEWVGTGVKATTHATLIESDAVKAACSDANLRKLTFPTSNDNDIKLAVTAESTVAQIGGASETGVAVYDSTTQVAAFAVAMSTVQLAPADEEKRIRDMVAATGLISNPLVQTFTTWDGYRAVRSGFDLAGTDSVAARFDALSNSIGGHPTGLSTSAAKGPFHVQLEVVLRDAVAPNPPKTIVVLAIASVSAPLGSAGRLDDFASGSSLARTSASVTTSQCETLGTTSTAKVDLLWVVDDSGSMGTSQTAVATVGAQVATRLSGGLADVRFAGVTTGFYGPGFNGSFRDWTPDVMTMLTWFRGSTAWGTSGDGLEEGFSGFEAFVTGAHPAMNPAVGGPFRPDAAIHVIILTDTHDQSNITANAMLTFIGTKFPTQRVVVHGVICPESPSVGMPLSCGDDPEDVVGGYHTVIRATGGVLGSILVFNPSPVTPQLAAMQATTMRAIIRSILDGAGYDTKFKPISASMRVAASSTGTCKQNSDIPHDEDKGWSLDLSGKLSFSTCVPDTGAKIVASYQAWVP